MTSLLLLSTLVAPRIFHVSPNGTDTNDGSAPLPWQTLARVSREALRPGDQIVLDEGATFDGSLNLTTGGTAKEPVIVRAGAKRATIVSNTGPAITVRTGGVEIRGLDLKGGATAKRDGHFGILLAAPKERKSSYVRIDDMAISGFGDAGISITGEKGSPNGFDDLQISKAKVTGVYGVGIISSDGIAFDSAGKTYAHKNWRITDCDTSENLGGAGIILSGVDGATVEFCRSANNRNADGGGLGMWAWCSRRVTFRHCIASGTRSSGDGGGYDLDGGTVECAIERCLSYDNDGPGAMHCDFPDAPRTHHNSIRENVSVNDGRKPKGEPFGYGFVVWGSGLYDCRIERNLVVLTQPDPQNRELAGLFATFIRMEKVKLETQRLERASFRDNVVEITPGVTGGAFVRNNFPPIVPRDVTFRGNAYRSRQAPPFLYGPNAETRWTTQREWQTTPAGKGDATSTIPKGRTFATLGDYKALAPRDLPDLFRRLNQ